MDVKRKAVKAYLKEINGLTRVCKIVEKDSKDCEVDNVMFAILLKEDLFVDPKYRTFSNVSPSFDETNNLLFKKYFGVEPQYNNNHSTWWAFNIVYNS